MGSKSGKLGGMPGSGTRIVEMPILCDYLAAHLKLVICGTAARSRSASLGRYYAGRGNQLWRVLHYAGITPNLLTPEEDQRVLEFGVGLSDIAKQKAGADSVLVSGDWDVAGFMDKIHEYQPLVVCFNGKRAAQIVLGRRQVQYGFQKEKLGETLLFVAPSTSGAARGSWTKVNG